MNIQHYIEVFEEWYLSLKIVKANAGPANGTIAATLILLERLKEGYDLNFDAHVAPGGAQIRGASGTAVANILKRFEENRPFAKEGGRTNRGGQGDIKPLFKSLELLKLEELSDPRRNQVLTLFQQYLVDRVRDFHNRQKIKLVFDPKLSTWQILHNLLQAAKEEGKAGFVAQHLVGAKLQLRFPEIVISNESASTADRPTNRQGDFLVGNTIFHITVAPMQAVFEKCQDNLTQGMKVYLLVPDAKLAAARQMGEQFCSGQIAVESLESFLSQNIDEISIFSSKKLGANLANLVKIYNERVDKVEVDKSLMIELPANLVKENL
ncbi:DUF4928 family protein [Haliscomenobacter hydrossis]|uniref:DUF4928 domain-containing protein n=1 Tax=Haliscomenobacter hydrossis (strain ATCC 27775 / DSM 1100 / LMG 10767 / O) TaxID=760192 RepID=F4L3M6_HALH1|nr:DUF4928 family protein [Haliscomenobacter hydrossis]AEE53976.1 hypothetical protein Halhy_6154 [Haliscomenobacter hydrossis DSM 1100]